MSKKNKNVNEPPKKSLEEMSDSEFITYADYLASPYYRAYVNARVRAEASNVPKSGGGFIGPSTAQTRSVKNPPADKNSREKKRGFFLFLILVLMLATLFVAAAYFLNMDALDKYVAIYNVPEGREIEVVDPETDAVTVEKADAYITLLDPTIGTVKNFLPSLGMESEFFSLYLEGGKLDDTTMMTKIGVFAVPVATTVIVICAVIGFLKALVALFSGRKQDGYYRKFKFGFMSILMFLCGLVLVVGGLYFSGLGFDGIVDFLTFKSPAFYAGYGLYAMLGLPILTFIFTCCAYKKARK